MAKVIVGGSSRWPPYVENCGKASFILPKGMDGQKMKIRAEIETRAAFAGRFGGPSAQPPNRMSLTIQIASG